VNTSYADTVTVSTLATAPLSGNWHDTASAGHYLPVSAPKAW
jgi:hypothetical protein